ncbi:MAG: hypothetical protein K6T81_10960 [Alicyclobacillus macrosporangiidus]|uniref:hypothetical protein n=1 Tax=Alicyclobacillus macrosporangiidus TaxID=392015 RepID=UPI0026F2560E|nr:hypothetical protein [Alicyclobacillus macrosporangiidus]MCL6599246.1 hypothetical protein [Alicyclobacillus macrosporangiidus]
MSCPSAAETAFYDIVIHYGTYTRTFVFEKVGCTLVWDEKDAVTLYEDLPAVSVLFR